MNITPKPFIELEDIQTNPEYWNQKISVIEFKDSQGKTYWNKDYNFIPKWPRYKEAKDWIKDTEFPEYDCKIVWNGNDGIEIVTQNYFGTILAHEQNCTWIIRKIQQKIIKEINDKLDFNKEEDLLIKKDLDTVLAFKTYQEFNNSPYSYIYEEHLEELKKTEKKKGKLSGKDLEKQAYDLNRSDIAILWRKQLYFISSYKYIDNYTLFVQIKAVKCPLALSYPTWLNSQGIGTLEQGPIIKVESPNFEDNQRMHYDFCKILGIKKIYQGAFISYQPEFQLFRAQVQTYSGGQRHITWSEQGNISGQEPKQLAIPTDIKLSRFDQNLGALLGNEWVQYGSLLSVVLLSKIPLLGEAAAPIAFRKLAQSILDTKVVLTIGPKEMNPNNGSYFSKMEEKEEILFPKNPTFTQWLRNQPHLLDHVTFQYFFLNKNPMSANGRFVGIKPRCDNCNNLIGEERPNKSKCQCSLEQRKIKDFVLPYKLFINYAPGNLYYRWEFKYINVKCEINTEGSFEDWTNPARIMKGINVSIKGGAQVAGTGVRGGYSSGMSWNSQEKEAGNIQSGDDPSSEQETHTDRMFKSTFKDNLDRTTEPAMFSSDTIDFHYSMGEFFNRLTDPIWFYRVDISEILYNNLTWANNKSTLLNLPFQWKELGSWTQKLGYYKWRNVYLEKDYQEFWKKLMHRGYLLTDGKDLENPKLSFAHANSHIAIGGNAWNISIAEEDIIEKEVVEEFEEKLVGFNTGDAHASFVTYFRTDDDNLYSQIASIIRGHQTGAGKTVRQANYTPNNNSVDNKNAFCWGCVIRDAEIPISQGGIVYTFFNQNQGSEEVMEIPDNCTLIIDTAKGEFRVKGKRIRKEYEVKIGKTTQTVNQEIDQEALENEALEETLEATEQENAEEILKELGGDKEREPEPEKEPEKEQEREQEGETEKENETETEKEKEKEQEKEKEKEKEKEQEKEKEKEKESEGEKSETEDEGDREEEDEK